MQPFWDVLWSDAKALGWFVAVMFALSLPASAFEALVGARRGATSWRGLWRVVGRGLFIGTAAALTISMLVEFSLKAEGLSDGRRALRDAASLRLCFAAPVVAFAAGLLVARRYAAGSLASGMRRRYTLRALFIGQLIAALLFGWWAFTRRDEIGQRRDDLEWHHRDLAAKAVFEPYAWKVQTWRDYDEIHLTPAMNPQPIGDEALRLVARHGPVVRLTIESDGVTNAGLAHLAEAQRLRQLVIRSKQISDDGVAHLTGLPRLRYLELDSPQLTGASLEYLAKVKSLRFLSLSTTKITGDERAAFRKARPDVDLRLPSPP